MCSHRIVRSPLFAAPCLLSGLLSGCCHAPAHERASHHATHGVPLHHRFDNAALWAQRFEAKERDAWQQPDAVLTQLALSPDAAVADIGAGTGYFAVRLARRLPRGTVFAVDIEPDMIRYLRARARSEALPNLSVSLAAPADPLLPQPVDLIFICDTYHHLPERVAYLRALVAYLKPGGRIAVVDFKPGPLPVGPPERHRVPLELLREEMTRAGLRELRHDTATLPYQYVAIYAPH